MNVFEEQKKAIAQEDIHLALAATAALTLFGAMAAMWLGVWQMRDWHVWAAWAIASFASTAGGSSAWRGAQPSAASPTSMCSLSVGAIGAYTGGAVLFVNRWLCRLPGS